MVSQELIRFDPNNIVVFNEFEGKLAELEKDAARTKHDFDDPQGLKDAKSDVKKATTSITAIEKIRKSEKKESLDYGRALDKKAKDITGRLEVVREINAGPIRDIKEAEEARLRCHNDNLNAFFAFRDFTESKSQDYEAELELIEKIALDDSWEEFRAKAAIAKDQSITQLKTKIASCKQLEADQAELIQRREEAVTREKADHEAKIAAEAETKAKVEAELVAERVKQDNIRKEREAKEAQEQREKSLQEARERQESENRLALETAKREKAEAEERAANAEKEAREKVLQEQKEMAREQSEREAREKFEAEAKASNKAHMAKINNDTKAHFMEFGLTEDQATKIIIALALSEFRHVAMIY